MSAAIETPVKTQNRPTDCGMSTPLFVPPTPLLKELGYGTGVHIYKIERSPVVGKTPRSPWVVKRLRGGRNRDEIIQSRLIAEAEILKSLNHPNIVGYRGSKTLTDDRVILAMEKCDSSLGNLIEERDEIGAGPLEASKIRKVAIDISNALDYLHTKAFLLHGDLKSYNVLIKNSFELCKLCDFGVSLPLNSEGYVDLEKNPMARYIGTDIYSAPEVFSAPPADISSKCDIFSFGLIIYECLSLRPPHYEHLENMDVGSELSIDETRQQQQQQQQQPKKLFDDSVEMKENISIAAVKGLVSKNVTLNDSQHDNSVLIRSTAATIGDDTAQDITGITFDDTINSEVNRNHTIGSSASFECSQRQPMRDVSISLNSTVDSEASSSFFEKSSQSLNDTLGSASLPPFYGTRPRIPDTYEYSDEYNICFETFYMCTHALPEERPTAGDLVKSFMKINDTQ